MVERYPAVTILPDYVSGVIDYGPSLSALSFTVSLARPKRIVELGVFRGDSLMMMAQSALENGLQPELFGVDWFQGDQNMGRYNGDEVLAQIHAYLKTVPQYRIRLMRMTCNEARPLFQNGSIDLLHIDAGHEYEEVKHDFENWLPAMSERGVVLFHDTHYSYSHAPKIQVWKFWSEVKRLYPHFEFPHACGVGLLAVGEQAPKPILDLCNAEHYEREAIQRFFFVMGQRVVDYTSLVMSIQGGVAWTPQPGIFSTEAGRSLAGLPGMLEPERYSGDIPKGPRDWTASEPISIPKGSIATSGSTERTDGAAPASKEVT
jgi:hypothetical protein